MMDAEQARRVKRDGPLRPAHEFLSQQEYKLWAVMTDAGQDVDVKIDVIFARIHGAGEQEQFSKQAHVGAVVSRVNRKLLCYRPLRVGQFTMSECIVPGELKRTYRLIIK